MSDFLICRLRSGQFISENARIQERYIFNAERTRYNYVTVIDDPTVYTRPFTIPARCYTEKDEPNGWHNEQEDATHFGKEVIREHYERVCTENNSGFGISAVK
ncbi:MAG TPA: hypothetical protein VN030_10455 [Cellvibrio sp.]|nr:hypothetical protein [Cellvibrio sp.]